MAVLRWGVVGTAKIAREKVVPAIQRAANCEVVAIASRDAARAGETATTLGIPTAHGSYEALLADEAVDAVYLPLPNDQHASWTIAAARAGKHVLCEKPLAMDVDEARTMIDACRAADVRLAEAFMYRLHPSWVETLRLVREGAIGELRAVRTWFSYHNTDPRNIRNRLENGGGAVMDIGCYAVDVSRMLFDVEPTAVLASLHRDPDMGVDVLSSAILTFPGGGQATFTCSTRAAAAQRVDIVGDRGRIEIAVPFNIPPDREATIRVTRAATSGTEVLTFPAVDQYTIQARTFAQAVLDGSELPVPIDGSLGNLRVIGEILAAG